MVKNIYPISLPENNSTQQAWDQINFLLRRFNFTSQQFAEEINYLLTEDPQFNSAQFTEKLLAKCHFLSMVASYWDHEPHYLTNDYQVQGAKRLLWILDLNEFLELDAKIHGSFYLDSYHSTRQLTTHKLQDLVTKAYRPSRFSIRNPSDSPPTTPSFPSVGGYFHYLSHPFTTRNGNFNS